MDTLIKLCVISVLLLNFLTLCCSEKSQTTESHLSSSPISGEYLFNNASFEITNSSNFNDSLSVMDNNSAIDNISDTTGSIKDYLDANDTMDNSTAPDEVTYTVMVYEGLETTMELETQTFSDNEMTTESPLFVYEEQDQVMDSDNDTINDADNETAPFDRNHTESIQNETEFTTSDLVEESPDQTTSVPLGDETNNQTTFLPNITDITPKPPMTIEVQMSMSSRHPPKTNQNPSQSTKSTHSNPWHQAPEMERCPSGCRCSAPPSVERRHYWHRLVRQYRMRKFIYGDGQRSGGAYSSGGGYGFHKSSDGLRRKYDGREMTCVGLKDIPDYVPNGVSNVLIYGKVSQYGNLQNDAADVTDYRDYSMTSSQNGKVNQITSVSKLNVIPSASMKRLWIEGNRIKVLHSHDFAMLSHLRALHLRSNRLKLLATGALHSLHHLVEIDLTHNHLTHVAKSTFKGLHRLRKVVLSRNRLVALHARLLADLENLEHLDVSYNFLIDLPEDIFNASAKLKQLDLSYNQLLILRPEWFEKMGNLQKLVLRGNRFEHIPDLVFGPLVNLTNLNVDKNELQKITNKSFYGLDSLVHLRMQHNNISQIEEGSFINMTNLKDLHLDDNNLDHIPVDLFAGLDNLTTLTLSGNKIKGVSPRVFDHLHRLEKLDLSKNRIEAIETQNFYGLYELKILRLDHNDITIIHDGGFAIGMVPNYSKLTWVYLNFNRLSMITAQSFSGLAYVKLLNLGHNEIELIGEDTFEMLSKLNTLLMNSNRVSYFHPGLFRKAESLRHINLGSNLLTNLNEGVFEGLEIVEDINLQNNEISTVDNIVFRDTPKLMSINLKKNKLRDFNLNIVNTAESLRYLTLSQNLISNLEIPSRAWRMLTSLSLTDNSLVTLSANITDVIADGGNLHLYGNPWSCDCELKWLLEENDKANDWSEMALGGSAMGHMVMFEGADEIECKSPPLLAGERLMRLDPAHITCPYEADEAFSNDAPVLDFLSDEQFDEEGTCDFSPLLDTQFEDEKDDDRTLVERWLVVLYDEHKHIVCEGVRVGLKHILTPTHCWKNNTLQQVYVKFGSNRRGPKPFRADLGKIVHYPGSLDLSLVRIQRPQMQLTSRIFPCLLSNDGLLRTQLESMATKVFARLYANIDDDEEEEEIQHYETVSYRQFHSHVITKPCVPDMLCLNVTDMEYRSPEYRDSELPIFVKISPSRWALAGIGDTKRYGNMLGEPVYSLAEWANELIR